MKIFISCKEISYDQCAGLSSLNGQPISKKHSYGKAGEQSRSRKSASLHKEEERPSHPQISLTTRWAANKDSGKSLTQSKASASKQSGGRKVSAVRSRSKWPAGLRPNQLDKLNSSKQKAASR